MDSLSSCTATDPVLHLQEPMGFLYKCSGTQWCESSELPPYLPAAFLLQTVPLGAVGDGSVHSPERKQTGIPRECLILERGYNGTSFQDRETKKPSPCRSGGNHEPPPTGPGSSSVSHQKPPAKTGPWHASHCCTGPLRPYPAYLVHPGIGNCRRPVQAPKC